MNNHLRANLFLSLFLFLSFTLSAQSGTYAQDIKEWYLEERFLIADTNDDALLEKNELASFSDEFAYYLVDYHFQVSDLNGDNRLSYNEIRNRVNTEMKYRSSLEQRELRSLLQRYPGLKGANIQYYLDNPDLTSDLFGNLTWMYAQRELVDEILSHKTWLSQHEEVYVELQKNLRWMVANPSEAEAIYNDRESTRKLPKLLGWRADHRNFIRKNRLNKKLYLIDFSSLD